MTDQGGRAHQRDWDDELERHGRVELDLSARDLRRLAAVGLALLVPGVLAVAAGASTRNLAVSGLLLLLGAVLVGFSAARLRHRRRVVVIDHHGVTSRYSRRRERLVPWEEIRDVVVHRVRGTAIVLVVVSAELEARLLASSGGRSSGAPTVPLPGPLDADPDELAAWLERRAAEAGPA